MHWHFRFSNPLDTATELTALAVCFSLLWHGYFVAAVFVLFIPLLIVFLFRHPRIDALCDTPIGQYTIRLWAGDLQPLLYSIAFFSLVLGAINHWIYLIVAALVILALFLLLPLRRRNDRACGDAGASVS